MRARTSELHDRGHPDGEHDHRDEQQGVLLKTGARSNDGSSWFGTIEVDFNPLT
jgi:hypothetical protein